MCTSYWQALLWYMVMRRCTDFASHWLGRSRWESTIMFQDGLIQKWGNSWIWHSKMAYFTAIQNWLRERCNSAEITRCCCRWQMSGFRLRCASLKMMARVKEIGPCSWFFSASRSCSNRLTNDQGRTHQSVHLPAHRRNMAETEQVPQPVPKSTHSSGEKVPNLESPFLTLSSRPQI